MDLGLNNKRALVIASYKGFGRGIAETLAAEGAELLLCGRDEAALQDAAKGIIDRGGRAKWTACDLSAPDFANTMTAKAKAELGGVDILVNNTGGPPPGTAQSITSDQIATHAHTMVGSVIGLTNLLLPGMIAAGWGRVLTLTSSGVEQPIPNLALSNTLRAALVGWSKTLAAEVAIKGITSNILIPGRIHTDRVDQLDAAAAGRQDKTVDAVRTASRASIPTGRYGKVEEFSSVAAFLCSDKAGYVNGAKIRCDGGAIRGV